MVWLSTGPIVRHLVDSTGSFAPDVELILGLWTTSASHIISKHVSTVIQDPIPISKSKEVCHYIFHAISRVLEYSLDSSEKLLLVSTHIDK